MRHRDKCVIAFLICWTFAYALIADRLTLRELKKIHGDIELLESRVEALEREVWPGTMTAETKGACNR